MSEASVKTTGKRGQRKSNIDIPQRFLDRLTVDGSLNVPNNIEHNATMDVSVLTLGKLFNLYYSARRAEAAAQRTLEDYSKHMQFRRILGAGYNGLDNNVPNRDVIRDWIRHMLTVCKN